MPTNQAATAVAMNSADLGPGHWHADARDAFWSPPTAKIQLPVAVRSSTQVATAVSAIHQTIAIWIR